MKQPEGIPGLEEDVMYSDVVDRQQSDAECIPEKNEVSASVSQYTA